MPKAALNGINLYYESHGKGFPVVIHHGFAGTTKSWEPQVGPLSKKYQFITFDMRGHGQSDSPRELSAYSMPIVVEDLYQLLKHLGVKQAVVGGLSLGGAISIQFYFKHPEMVRALILADSGPGYRNPEGEGMKAWNKSRIECAEILEKEGIEGFIKSRYSLSDYYTDPVVMRKHDPIGLANINRGVMLNQIALPIEQIKVPTLIICGDRDKDFLPAADYMNQKIPSSQKVIIPNAGHGSNVDQPEAFNRAILDFMKKIGL